MKKISVVIAATLALSAVTGTAFARDPIKSAIGARKAAFTLIASNFGPMGAMTKGKIPFNKDEFARRAANLEALSKMPWEYFIAGSDKGDTEAKAAVWSKADEFKTKADEFEKEIAALAQVAQGDDMAAIGAQFGKVAKTCKACHKEFKED